MTFLATGFQEADMDASGSLIACLNTIDSHPFFRATKEESYQLLEILPSSKMLEIGCGTGADALRLADFTTNEGLVVGIDLSLSMIQSARNIMKAPVLYNPINHIQPDFLCMDGRYLAFSDNTFDAAREDRALQHINHPELVICEMLRVLKPGGRFVIFEPDWELFIIEGSDKSITRRILNFWADTFMNGWIGRNLYRYCLTSGALDVTILPRTLILHDFIMCDRIFAIRDTVTLAKKSGVITNEDADSWLSYLEEADRSGRFFSSFTGYLVFGKKDSLSMQ